MQSPTCQNFFYKFKIFFENVFWVKVIIKMITRKFSFNPVLMELYGNKKKEVPGGIYEGMIIRNVMTLGMFQLLLYTRATRLLNVST